MRSRIFSKLRDGMKKAGYMSEVFTFIDASHLISKANLWEERDKTIQAKYEKLNNKNLPKVSKDKEMRIGCKGKDKFWCGYKKHISVDMQSGLINKVSVTKANVSDGSGLKHVSPSLSVIYADIGYCGKSSANAARRKGATKQAIKRNNMKGKNKDLDRWISKVRSPHEGVFSKCRKRVRYAGVVKNQFAEFMQAICYNLKKLLSIIPPDRITAR